MRDGRPTDAFVVRVVDEFAHGLRTDGQVLVTIASAVRLSHGRHVLQTLNHVVNTDVLRYRQRRLAFLPASPITIIIIVVMGCRLN